MCSATKTAYAYRFAWKTEIKTISINGELNLMIETSKDNILPKGRKINKITQWINL